MRKARPDGGDCYRSAFKKLRALAGQKEESGFYLVHGVAIGRGRLNGGKLFGHAWIENEEIVIDARFGAFEKARYYALGRIKFVERYTMKQAAARMLRTGHYGPWAAEIYRAESWLKPGARVAVAGRPMPAAARNAERN